ncbi:MAG: uracil phosphoribosyltransferase [Bacteroidetes bacterium]|nr:MAG: uracil phosphoribosyltransferase [Bacteroidota bacterium]
MGKVHILNRSNTVVNKFIAQLRDKNIQQDSWRFRKNLERIGEVCAYEISKTLSYQPRDIVTPLGVATENIYTDTIVVATILRAGLPLHQGVLNYFDDAQNAFVSAYRKHHKDGTFDINIEYLSSPNITGKILILTDPMLATGRSMVLGYQALLTKGKPKHTHIVSVIGSTEGLQYVQGELGDDVTIWISAVDEEMTSQAYIVPGLGDAGDLAFGIKE